MALAFGIAGGLFLFFVAMSLIGWAIDRVDTYTSRITAEEARRRARQASH